MSNQYIVSRIYISIYIHTAAPLLRYAMLRRVTECYAESTLGVCGDSILRLSRGAASTLGRPEFGISDRTRPKERWETTRPHIQRYLTDAKDRGWDEYCASLM